MVLAAKPTVAKRVIPGAVLQGRFRQALTSTALRLSAIIWAFGYILVQMAAVAQGRSILGPMFLANLPLLGSGSGLSYLLGALLDRSARRRA